MHRNTWKNHAVVVTGGTGFIGSCVVEQLCELGAQVTVPTRHDNHPLLDDIENRFKERIALVQTDLMDHAAVTKLLSRTDVVFHLAAYKKNSQVHTKKAADVLHENLSTTLNVFRACVANHVKRVVTLSSEIVANSRLEQSHYGYWWSKKMLEVLAHAYHMQYQLPITVVRAGNTYGPRDNFDPETAQVIPAFIRRIVARENPFFMWGDGTQKRAFVYVEDLARALITIAASPTVDEQHHIVSLYGSETITMNELAETIMNIEHFKVPISHDTTKGNEQPSGNNESTMDTPIPALQLDAKPTPLVEGLTKTIAWYKAHHS